MLSQKFGLISIILTNDGNDVVETLVGSKMGGWLGGHLRVHLGLAGVPVLDLRTGFVDCVTMKTVQSQGLLWL